MALAADAGRNDAPRVGRAHGRFGRGEFGRRVQENDGEKNGDHGDEQGGVGGTVHGRTGGSGCKVREKIAKNLNTLSRPCQALCPVFFETSPPVW